ncbi:MAG: glycosyltransferase family 9 protein [Phycisphaerales bacterium]|nr:glycosyltransferase family 9 protein [Phycisphaerales bacterium]
MAHTPRILIIRPSALGDVCRTVPVLVSLRRSHPDARIDWLIQDSFEGAIAHHPALTHTVPFPRRLLGQAIRRLDIAPVMHFLDALAQVHYDLVVDVQGLARSGFFAYWTGAPRRIGLANARELGWLGLNERHHIPRNLHTVDRMLEVLRLAGVPPVPDMRLYASDAARRQLHSLGHTPTQIKPGPYVVIAPTSRWPAKRWPADRFANVASHLAARGLTVILVGSRSERDQCAPLLALAARTPLVIDLIGQTTVAQLMALIESSSLVIANDSAALHMAVGFDRPLIGLYGPTDISLVGPYRRDADVIQHITPADKLNHKDDARVDLMRRITTDEVIAAAEQRLANDSPRRR